ncbi:MAG: AsmA family protein, partial [Acidobacteria bacterium]|nr:AsmA family protein [Candidatus Sulfomarinibacter sp. MAG AM2]
KFAAHGTKLASLNRYLDQTGMPPVPFSVSGNADITNATYLLDGVVADIDGNRIALDGTVTSVTGLVGTDLKIEVAIPDLRQAGHLVTELANLPELPDEPLTLTTRLAIDGTGFQIDNLEGTLANAEASIDGLVGPPPGFVGTDLTIDSDGPNASLFTAFTGVTVPVAPFKISGRIQRTEDLFLFDRVAVQLGGHSVSLHGSLGEAPRLVGTDLELHASGDSTALIAELAGFRKLPDHPFRVSGRFKGTPERFATDGFEIMLGESDLKGSLEVDIRAKPTVTATVTSNHLDLSHYLKQLEQVIDDEPEEGATPGTTSGSTAISDKPIDFSPLRRADAEIDITVGTIQFPLMVLSEVELVAKLNDGRLEIERLAAIGQDQGHVSGSMVLEPKDDRYFLRTDLEARQLRLDIAGSTVARMDQPPIDIDINLEAVGATPHELASTASGAIQLVIGKGTMDSKVLDLVTADILLTLLNSFNPFAKQDAATEMQCGVALLSIADGLATLEPMAFQSDKMTMLGDGRIDLGTEKLNLEW